LKIIQFFCIEESEPKSATWDNGLSFKKSDVRIQKKMIIRILIIISHLSALYTDYKMEVCMDQMDCTTQ
jgi:phage-related holin